MSLLNYSAPYVATPAPPPAHYYRTPVSYNYPRPHTPFLAEERPTQPPPYSYTRVSNGGVPKPTDPGVDYDDYYDDEEEVTPPAVTPIQGPIFLKNGTVPVVPLFSYPVLNNGTFIQIPVSKNLFKI